MNILNAILIGIQVVTSVLLVVLILLHSGKGGGLSGMFGGAELGGSTAGSTVVERNLDRITVVCALVFGMNSVLLALLLQ